MKDVQEQKRHGVVFGQETPEVLSKEAAIGWAVLHRPTREAYRRSTGEDATSVLDRFLGWVEENIIGTASHDRSVD